MPQSQFNDDESKLPDGVNSGRWTVLGMFAFAATMVLLLYLYWDAYTKPFRELQFAIAEEFEDSSPLVIGGKHKSHKNLNPNTLRIVVRIPLKDFDPTQDEAQSKKRAMRLVELAGEYHDLSKYEVIEIHLRQLIPEKATQNWSLIQSIDEWQDDLNKTKLKTMAVPE